MGGFFSVLRTASRRLETRKKQAKLPINCVTDSVKWDQVKAKSKGRANNDREQRFIYRSKLF